VGFKSLIENQACRFGHDDGDLIDCRAGDDHLWGGDDKCRKAEEKYAC